MDRRNKLRLLSIKWWFKKNKSWFFVFFLLILLSSLFTGIYYGIIYWKKSNFEAEVNAAIITAIVTTLTLTVTVVITAYFNYKAQRANLRDRLFEKRQELYNKIYYILSEIHRSLNCYETIPDEKYLDKIYNYILELREIYHQNYYTLSSTVRVGMRDVGEFFIYSILREKIKNDYPGLRELSEGRKKILFSYGKLDKSILNISDYRYLYDEYHADFLLDAMGKEMGIKAVENDFKLLQK